MKRLFLLTALAFLLSPGFTQETNKDKFEKEVFDKELGEAGEPGKFDQPEHFRSPDELPSWFFDGLESDEVIAVSDPLFEDTTKALKQAKARAKMLFAMKQNARISMVADYYNKIVEKNVSASQKENFYEFGVLAAEFDEHKYDPFILEKHFTRFGELIIKVRFDEVRVLNTNRANISNFRCTFFYSDVFKGNRRTQSKRINITGPNWMYQSVSVGNRSDVSSKFGKETSKDIAGNTYKYFNADGTEILHNKALWHLMWSKMLDQVVLLIHQNDQVILKNVDEQYKDEYRSLIRQVSDKKIKVNLSKLQLDKEEGLKVGLDLG